MAGFKLINKLKDGWTDEATLAKTTIYNCDSFTDIQLKFDVGNWESFTILCEIVFKLFSTFDLNKSHFSTSDLECSPKQARSIPEH